ncbi:PIGF/3-ketodihydrosphingosine reductase fusion protein-like [Aristolochia californica]|uniref:PIGF/3-ketodihydrosphingosine reductase fusion protein-like n=1 Tax=Aristolochia californica TaxID=171875 RepID=UPI0035D81379
MSPQVEEKIASDSFSSPLPKVFVVHFLCCFALAAAFWLAHVYYSSNLVSDPVKTLLVLWNVECPIVLLGYSFFRQDPENCSYWKAVGRGIIGLSAGALLNASGAVILGAPVGPEYLTKTINWSFLMSLFTVVPSATVFGSSWPDWQRLFADSKITGSVDHMISLPAHGAVIGAWFGAWPMPLDWERPWQEWPICVSYGAVTGYLLGILASLSCTLVFRGRKHAKSD